MQFKDLQKSYQVYVLYKDDKIRYKMATVVSVANSRFQPLQPGQLSYHQPQDKIVDIELSIDGVTSTYVVRENMSVEVRSQLTISCDREPIINEINAIMRNSKEELDNMDKHRSILESCEEVMMQLNPSMAIEKDREERISRLEKTVENMDSKMEDIRDLILELTKKD